VNITLTSAESGPTIPCQETLRLLDAEPCSKAETGFMNSTFLVERSGSWISFLSDPEVGEVGEVGEDPDGEACTLRRGGGEAARGWR
jgi:hypothetical protein